MDTVSIKSKLSLPNATMIRSRTSSTCLNRHETVLEHAPLFISDTGCVIVECITRQANKQIWARTDKAVTATPVVARKPFLRTNPP